MVADTEQRRDVTNRIEILDGHLLPVAVLLAHDTPSFSLACQWSQASSEVQERSDMKLNG
jgi:hypothetical protein